MRIVIVSTHPPIECGVGTYSQYMSEALRKKKNEVYLVSPFGAKGKFVIPCYSTESMSLGMDIFSVVNKLTPDVLHIQHEYGMYGPRPGEALLDLYYHCMHVGLPIVTTLHTVSEKLTEEEYSCLNTIIPQSKAIVVHEEFHKETLALQFGNMDKVYVIPHGVREVTEISDARKKVGVDGKTVLLLCGYLRATKRHDKVIRIFPHIVEQVPDAVLVVTAKSRAIEQPKYQKEIFHMIEESPVSNRIIVLHGQLPQRTFDTILSAADVVPLPYEMGGQSGIMAQCFAFHKPVVTSNLRAFKNWIELSKGGLVANTDEEFEAHVIRLMKDRKLRESMKRNIEKFVREEVSWGVLAEKYMAIYEKLMRRPTSRSRHVYWG